MEIIDRKTCCYIVGHKWYYYFKPKTKSAVNLPSVGQQNDTYQRLRNYQLSRVAQYTESLDLLNKSNNLYMRSNRTSSIRSQYRERRQSAWRQKSSSQSQPIRVLALLDEYNWAQVSRSLIVQLTIEQKRLFAIFPGPTEFLAYEAKFPPEYRGFYETVLGQSGQKPHFDLDVNLIESADLFKSVPGRSVEEIIDDLLQHLIRAVLDIFLLDRIELDLSQDILLFSSHGPEKRSFHLVIDHYYHSNHQEAKAFYQLVLSRIPQFYHRWIDPKVYSSLQQFRLEGSQKINSGRPKVLNRQWLWQADPSSNQKVTVNYQPSANNRLAIFQASLLGYITGCTELPAFTSRLPEKPVQKINSLNLTEEDVQQALQLLADDLNLSSNSVNFPFQFNKVVDGLIILKRVQPSYCPICQRRHENEHPFLFIIGQNKRVYFNCRREENNKNHYLGSLEGPSEGKLESIEASDQDLLALPVEVPTVDQKGQIITTNQAQLATVTSTNINSVTLSTQSATSPPTNTMPKAAQSATLPAESRVCLAPTINSPVELEPTSQFNQLQQIAQGMTYVTKTGRVRGQAKRKVAYRPPIQLLKDFGIVRS